MAAMEVVKGHAVTDEGEFGHGFALAGCLFVHLLGQRANFELLDYSYHVLAVEQGEKDIATATGETAGAAKGATTGGASGGGDRTQELKEATVKFIESACGQKALHTELFALLESKLPTKREIVTFLKVVQPHGIVLYLPPALET